MSKMKGPHSEGNGGNLVIAEQLGLTIAKKLAVLGLYRHHMRAR